MRAVVKIRFWGCPSDSIIYRTPREQYRYLFRLLLGVRIRGTPGDIDPLNKVPFKRAISRVQKGPL